MPQDAAQTRWVVWSPDTSQATPKLRLSGWDGKVYQSVYDAFAEICLSEHAGHLRRSWGLARHECVALVLVADSCQAFLADLLGAIARFAPDASVWRADGDRIEPVPAPESTLEPANSRAPNVEVAAQNAPRPPRPALRPRPSMHGARDRYQLVRSGFPEANRLDDPDLRISADELAMLLGDNAGEASNGG